MRWRTESSQRRRDRLVRSFVCLAATSWAVVVVVAPPVFAGGLVGAFVEAPSRAAQIGESSLLDLEETKNASLRPPPLLVPTKGAIRTGFYAEDRYGPGHRGIDIATSAGMPVYAAADGIVAFAGRVASNLVVTIDHDGGWKTSYSYLSQVSTSEGNAVARGTVLGLAGSLHGTSAIGVHFSLRHGEEYLDPSPYLVRAKPVLLPPSPDAALEEGVEPELGNETPLGNSEAALRREEGNPESSSTGGVPRKEPWPLPDRETTFGKPHPRYVGCSVALFDCVPGGGNQEARYASILATALSKARRLSHSFLELLGVVADGAARVDRAVSNALGQALERSLRSMEAWLAALAGLAKGVSLAAVPFLEVPLPRSAASARRRSQRLISAFEKAVASAAAKEVSDLVRPVVVASSIRERSASLVGYQLEATRRWASCRSKGEAGSSGHAEAKNQPTSSLAGRHESTSRSEVEESEVGSPVYVIVGGLNSSLDALRHPGSIGPELQRRGNTVLYFSYTFGPEYAASLPGSVEGDGDYGDQSHEASSGDHRSDRSKDGAVGAYSRASVAEPPSYGPEDTRGDPRAAAANLMVFLESVAREYPARPVVVVGHSQGGLVARYALSKVRRAQGVRLPPVAALVTIATPNRGSAAASDLRRLGQTVPGSVMLDRLAPELGPTARSKAVSELARGSDFTSEVGTQAPDGVPSYSIAGSTDLVVPAGEAYLDGATNVLVPTGSDGIAAHSEVASLPATIEVVEGAAMGKKPCQDPMAVAAYATESALASAAAEQIRAAVVAGIS